MPAISNPVCSSMMVFERSLKTTPASTVGFATAVSLEAFKRADEIVE